VTIGTRVALAPTTARFVDPLPQRSITSHTLQRSMKFAPPANLCRRDDTLGKAALRDVGWRSCCCDGGGKVGVISSNLSDARMFHRKLQTSVLPKCPLVGLPGTLDNIQGLVGNQPKFVLAASVVRVQGCADADADGHKPAFHAMG